MFQRTIEQQCEESLRRSRQRRLEGRVRDSYEDIADIGVAVAIVACVVIFLYVLKLVMS